MADAIPYRRDGATPPPYGARSTPTRGAGAANDNIPRMLEGLKRPSEHELGAAACFTHPPTPLKPRGARPYSPWTGEIKGESMGAPPGGRLLTGERGANLRF